MRHTIPGSAMLLAACACAQEVQQITVAATRASVRESETTTAIVIGHEEITRHGDSTLADVLKRQPGITVDGAAGKAGTIRMRGLGNGYTSILLNGVPAPDGFSLESITPNLIERIEIRRAATAEFSNQAIAGSINVILRKGGAQPLAELKAGSAYSHACWSPSVNAQRSGRAGAFAYTLVATLKRDHSVSPSTILEQGGQPELLRSTANIESSVEDTIELAPRLSWQQGEDATITSQSYLRWRHVDDGQHQRESTLAGAATQFPNSDSRYVTRPVNLYSDLAWTRRLAEDARLETKAAAYYNTRRADFRFVGADAATRTTGLHQVASGPSESDLTISGSYRRPIGSGHALALGWEAGKKWRSEYRREQQGHSADTLVLVSDEDFDASVQRTALFAQDEWDMAPGLSLYMGLRREDLHTLGEGNAHAPVDVRAGVWSPLAQVLWKPGTHDAGTARDQFRLALGRTYKAPRILDLMPRRYTVDNNNSATNPDQQGNPSLRPELAWGMDAAWERYFAKDSMVSVSAYMKRIRDVTLDRVFQNNGVWIVTPDNNGDASARGIEAEAKLGWRQVSVRANAVRNWSRVTKVPGPDNRLDKQVPFSASLGADYNLAGDALSAGGTYSFRSSVPARQSAVLWTYAGVKRELDVYALWKVDAKSKWRAGASNLLHQDYATQDVYADGAQLLSRASTASRFTTLRLTWEHSL
jgi:outer membrane receptor protein involved in Fe transport